MKKLLIFALIALTACSWAGFTTKTHDLKRTVADDFLSAIDKGDIQMPEGVTLSVTVDDHRMPRVSVSGEEAAVDAALGAIVAWDVTPTQVVVKVQFLQGDRVLSSPILRTLVGRPAQLAQTFQKGHTANTITDSGMRLLVVEAGKDSIELRVTLIANDKRLVVPFALGTSEDLAVRTLNDGLYLTAKNVKTGDVRKLRVSEDWKPLLGMTFTFRTEIASVDGVVAP